jgi:hypothetical protein
MRVPFGQENLSLLGSAALLSVDGLPRTFKMLNEYNVGPTIAYPRERKVKGSYEALLER